MGLSLGFSKSTGDPSGPPALPNPNPKNYRILRIHQCGPHLVVEVRYPDCTNYEGRKILVFKNTTRAQLDAQGAIDPHFAGNPKFISPFARFEPTSDGWSWALRLARELDKE